MEQMQQQPSQKDPQVQMNEGKETEPTAQEKTAGTAYSTDNQPGDEDSCILSTNNEDNKLYQLSCHRQEVADANAERTGQGPQMVQEQHNTPLQEQQEEHENRPKTTGPYQRDDLEQTLVQEESQQQS